MGRGDTTLTTPTKRPRSAGRSAQSLGGGALDHPSQRGADLGGDLLELRVAQQLHHPRGVHRPDDRPPVFRDTVTLQGRSTPTSGAAGGSDMPRADGRRRVSGWARVDAELLLQLGLDVDLGEHAEALSLQLGAAARHRVVERPGGPVSKAIPVSRMRPPWFPRQIVLLPAVPWRSGSRVSVARRCGTSPTPPNVAGPPPVVSGSPRRGSATAASGRLSLEDGMAPRGAGGVFPTRGSVARHRRSWGRQRSRRKEP